jgi:hypothetical protein
MTATDIEAVKAKVSVLEVIAQHVALKPKRGEHIGLCPFHREKTPSFTVNESKGFFHCFGCGAHGDVIDAAMKLGNLDFMTAVQRLRDDAGITRELTPDEVAALDIQRREREAAEAAELAVKVGQAAAIWKAAVPVIGTPAETYLRGRGIDPARLVAKAWPHTLRYSTSAMIERPNDRPMAALVVAVGSRAGEFKGLQRIFLRPNGTPALKADGDKLKLSLGDIRGNSAKFAAAADSAGRWGIAEGGENAIAAQQLYHFPVEAGISSGNMQNVTPPNWAKHVTIFADHDGAGFIAAQNCRQQYVAIATVDTVCVLAANRPGADVADLLIEGTVSNAA